MKRENKRKRKRGRISIRLMTTVHHLLSTFQTEFGTNSFFLIQRISLTKCNVSQTNQTNKEINRSTRKGRKKKIKREADENGKQSYFHVFTHAAASEE